MIHNHSDKVKRTVRAVFTLCPLLLLPFVTACYEYEDSDRTEAQKEVPLTFYLQPTNHQTRAYVGDVAEEEGEDAIRSIKVWLFDGNTCVDYSENIANNKVTMSIPQSYVGQSVDVYIIANAKSVGLDNNDENALNGDTPLNTLKGAFFGGNYFGPAAPTTSVPSDGLPMSRIVKNCPITLSEDGMKATLPEILITRAVSKIRFAFARTKDHTGQILGISLDGDQIAANEYIFPVDPDVYPNDYNYVTSSPHQYLGDYRANLVSDACQADAMKLGNVDLTTNAPAPEGTTPLVTTIEEVVDENDPTLDPYAYEWTTWVNNHSGEGWDDQRRATEYNTLMDTYVTNEVYLRESHKQIKGWIYYRLSPNGDVKRQQFYMLAQSEVQDFARNHEWIVYGYFLGDKFNLKVQTIAWEDSWMTVDYTETIHWKEDGAPKWLPTLNNTNSTTESIDGTDFTVLLVNGGDEPSCAFTLDAPVGWEWLAVLEPLTEGASNYIYFLGGSETLTGSVGQASLISIKINDEYTSVTHRSRLRLYVRTPSGDQSREVPVWNYIISRNI